MPRRRALACLAAGVAALCAGPGTLAQESPQAALLVATPDLVGSMFEKSLVLVLRAPDAQTIGLILNLPAAERPGEAAPPQPGDPVAPPVYRGGPLSVRAPFAIAETALAVERTLPVTAGVRFAAGAAAVRALLDASAGARSKLFAGYSGWAPGQLAQEVAAGFWDVRPLADGVLFDPDPATQWQRLSGMRRAV